MNTSVLTHIVDSVYLRGAGRTSFFVTGNIVLQDLVVIWNNNPNTERTADEEEHQTPHKGSIGFLHQSSWVFCLSSCHGNELGPNHPARLLHKEVLVRREGQNVRK